MRCGRIWPKLGIVAAQAREGLKQLLAIIADEGDERAPIRRSCESDPAGGAASGAADGDWMDREAARGAASRECGGQATGWDEVASLR